jgi:hypothetical protein
MGMPISHKRARAEYSEEEYLALAKALLGGELDQANLRGPIGDAAKLAFDSSLLPADQGESVTFVRLLNALVIWYAARDDLQRGRVPMDSPQALAAERLIREILSICGPRLAESLATGDYKAFHKLAAVMEAAQKIPSLGDQTAHDKSTEFVSNALGLKARKPQKKTGRIRSLLPLWVLGFGDLSQSKRFKILEKAGLKVEEIPEDDALRQILSYYEIPNIRRTVRDARRALMNQKQGESRANGRGGT